MSLHSEISMYDFQRIPEIEDMEEINNKRFKNGDLFLAGKEVISQKYNKSPGDTITVYQITEMKESTCVYFPIFLKIKKETKNA